MADEPAIPLDSGRPDRLPPWVRRLAWLAFLPTLLLVGVVVYAQLDRGRASGENPRAICASHLHQIGLAILLYQVDHDGRFPATFDDLLRVRPANEQIDPREFICPLTNDTVPTTWPTTGPAVLTAGHCSYVYLGRGLTDKTVQPDTVVAFEPVANHGDGSNVLYGDGRVEWLDATHAVTLPTTGTGATDVR